MGRAPPEGSVLPAIVAFATYRTTELWTGRGNALDHVGRVGLRREDEQRAHAAGRRSVGRSAAFGPPLGHYAIQSAITAGLTQRRSFGRSRLGWRWLPKPLILQAAQRTTALQQLLRPLGGHCAWRRVWHMPTHKVWPTEGAQDAGLSGADGRSDSKRRTRGSARQSRPGMPSGHRRGWPALVAPPPTSNTGCQTARRHRQTSQ